LPIKNLTGIDIITNQGLLEIFAGKWQTMNFDDLEKRFPDDY